MSSVSSNKPFCVSTIYAEMYKPQPGVRYISTELLVDRPTLLMNELYDLLQKEMRKDYDGQPYYIGHAASVSTIEMKAAALNTFLRPILNVVSQTHPRQNYLFLSSLVSLLGYFEQSSEKVTYLTCQALINILEYFITESEKQKVINNAAS